MIIIRIAGGQEVFLEEEMTSTTLPIQDQAALPDPMLYFLPDINLH